MPEHPGHRESGDVRVEQSHGEAAGGQAGGQVDRHRRLAHAAFARRDGQDPGAPGDLGDRRVAPGRGGGPGP